MRRQLNNSRLKEGEQKQRTLAEKTGKNYIKIRVNKLKVYNFDEGCNYAKRTLSKTTFKVCHTFQYFPQKEKSC